MNIFKFNLRKGLAIFAIAAVSLSSCNDFLDRAPLSQVTPEVFLQSEADLSAFTINAYSFPTHAGFNVGTFGYDNHTDNQASANAHNIWIPGEYRVAQAGGSWELGQIRNINYYLQNVVPRWKNGDITGNTVNVDHYVGEGYFLRAYQYFNKLQAVGDFPIIKHTLIDERATLTEASKRRPRNEVARFILSDLDSAILLMNNNPVGGKNRLTKNAALLFKSRVALYEGSWLTYHQGTAHVLGGPGWPDQGKVEGFSIDIAQEIDFFLGQAMTAAEQVADNVPLTVNAKDDGYDSSENPYFRMFGSHNLNSYDEVLLWRDYDPSLGISHNVNHYINRNGGSTGYTKGFVDNFLMANGLPIYAAGSGYKGDDYIADVKSGRDNRLQIFMKAPGELRVNDLLSPNGDPVLEGVPDITGLLETRYVTGYGLKKGMNYSNDEGEGNVGSTGSIVFRAVEAYLN